MPLEPDQVEIQVKAVGMNFKDVMIAMGQLIGENVGFDCAGIISRVGDAVTDLAVGTRVCCVSDGAYSTFTRVNRFSVHRIPDDMTIETAASIPVIFCTAYYSLFDQGRLCRGEKILIHAAAGGVGQAAILLAQHAGAEIFATVSSEAKKSLLMSQYGIPEDHIFYSRNNSFGPAIRQATGGYGVDVVLNSLAGDLLQETWSCIADFGRFIEIGKADIIQNNSLHMAPFVHNATFTSVDLALVQSRKPRLLRRLLEDVFNLLMSGAIRMSIPLEVVAFSKLESAFRKLQGGRSVGKLIAVPREDDQVKVGYPGEHVGKWY